MINQEKVLAVVRESVAADVVRAGEILLSYYKDSLSRTYKADGSFATQADHASEKYLIEKLRPLLPGAGFYAEESGIVTGTDYTWVIDPLDGTTNFAHSLPYFCVSVALCYKGAPILAFIYQPVLKELFSAEKGKGAFVNGHPLSVSGVTSMDKALITTGCARKASDRTERVVKKFSETSIRYFGAAALDAAYCAAGKVDGCLYEGTSWWDVAAGKLLIEEAGGKTSTLTGAEVSAQDSSFIGANELIYTTLFKAL